MGDYPGPAKESLDFSQLVMSDTGPITASRPTYTPKRVRPRHRMVVMLHESGMQNKDIAKATGYKESRVSIILSSRHPELMAIRASFAKRIADKVGDIQDRLALYANEMLDVMVTHARNVGEAANSRQAAKELLHMAGFSPVHRELRLSANIPKDELDETLKRVHDANQVSQRAAEWAVDAKAS